MSFKEFLKPNLTKIILILIFMGGINYYLISTTFIIDARILVGIPLGFYPIGSFFGGIYPNSITPSKVEFSVTSFLLDIIFWYLISCVVVLIYNKIRKK